MDEHWEPFTEAEIDREENAWRSEVRLPATMTRALVMTLIATIRALQAELAAERDRADRAEAALTAVDETAAYKIGSAVINLDRQQTGGDADAAEQRGD